MNSVERHSEDSIPEQHSSNTVSTPPTHTSEASFSQRHTQNPEPASAPANDAPAARSIRQRKRPSQRRINANRQNAKRSTGPRTTRGRKTVSQNAIKHGVFAKEVVITGVDGEEDPEQFEALYTRIWEAWQPVGTNEEMLVEEMAVIRWRRARVLRAENGEISKRLNSAAASALLSRPALASQSMSLLHVMQIGLKESRCGDRFLRSPKLSVREVFGRFLPEKTSERLDALRENQINVKMDFSGATQIIVYLRHAKHELETLGWIPVSTLDALVSLIGISDFPLVSACIAFTEGDHEREKTESENASDEEAKAAVIHMIDEAIAYLELLRQHALQSRLAEIDAESRSCSLPAPEVTDRLLRYDAHFERQYYRAMHELERSQRRRKGDIVPAPVKVDVS